MSHSKQQLVQPSSFSNMEETFINRFSESLEKRLYTWPSAEREMVLNLAREVAEESFSSLGQPEGGATNCLPVANLRVQEVIEQGKVNMSQATLYRAAEDGRFYCVVPPGKAAGKVFPAWQFVDPVPELLGQFSPLLKGHPMSDIHAFWVTAEDELNELSPAELLAGKVFEARLDVHPSQQRLLALPTPKRIGMINSLLNESPWRMEDIES